MVLIFSIVQLDRQADCRLCEHQVDTERQRKLCERTLPFGKSVYSEHDKR